MLSKSLIVAGGSIDEQNIMVNVSLLIVIAVANFQYFIFSFGHGKHFDMETIGGELATNIVPNPNLESKVLFEGRRDVINLAMVAFGALERCLYIEERNNLLGFMSRLVLFSFH